MMKSSPGQPRATIRITPMSAFVNGLLFALVLTAGNLHGLKHRLWTELALTIGTGCFLSIVFWFGVIGRVSAEGVTRPLSNEVFRWEDIISSSIHRSSFRPARVEIHVRSSVGSFSLRGLNMVALRAAVEQYAPPENPLRLTLSADAQTTARS